MAHHDVRQRRRERCGRLDAAACPGELTGGGAVDDLPPGACSVSPWCMQDTSAELARRVRRLHERLLPLMQVNFVESNPIPVPVKAALAAMGLPDRGGLPPADGAARPRLPRAHRRGAARAETRRV